MIKMLNDQNICTNVHQELDATFLSGQAAQDPALINRESTSQLVFSFNDGSIVFFLEKLNETH